MGRLPVCGGYALFVVSGAGLRVVFQNREETVFPMVQTQPHIPGSEFPETLEAAKEGLDWAWRNIYRGLVGPITGYLASRGAVDPDDLAAEVFLQVARDIGRFEGDEPSFRSWVFVIAHRRLIDARRAASRRPVTTQSTDRLSNDSIGGDVEEEAIEQLAVAQMRELFDTLTDAQRDVLALRVIADLTLEETAKVVGKRVGAVKALQRRGLFAIKDQLENGRVTL